MQANGQPQHNWREKVHVFFSLPSAIIVLFLTANLALVSCGNKDCWMDWWYDTNRPYKKWKNKLPTIKNMFLMSGQSCEFIVTCGSSVKKDLKADKSNIMCVQKIFTPKSAEKISQDIQCLQLNWHVSALQVIKSFWFKLMIKKKQHCQEEEMNLQYWIDQRISV